MSEYIGLDLGNTFGVATWCGQSTPSAYFVTIAKSGDMQRWRLFEEYLITAVLPCKPPKKVYYEMVMRHIGVHAAHAYGGFLAAMHTAIYRKYDGQALPEVKGLSVTAVKKFWTGSGAATKVDMINAAKARGYDVKNDNAVDALAVLSYGLSIDNIAIR